MLQRCLELERVENEGWANCLQIAQHIACLWDLLIRPVVVTVADFLVVDPLGERLDEVRHLQAVVGQAVFRALVARYDVASFVQISNLDVDLLYEV